MITNDPTKATEILEVIRSLSASYKKNTFLTFSQSLAYKICWIVYGGTVDVSVTENDSFIFVEIKKLYDDDIVDRYKFSKIML